ncbi:MAG TPA: carbohydrate kinase family protein [Patescibacteria group bacterium]|nr:carbohydrate kinase family protein [Patescibacteria group bacterium]
MNNSFDLITIGDSTIDTFIKIHDATIECDINKKDCKICIKYGEKIPVDSISHSAAGNALNVAMGAQKLGLNSAIYTNLGDDEHGHLIKKKLVQSKVSEDYIQVDPSKESNLSVVLTFKGERTIFVYHQTWDYSLPDLFPCSFLYLTSTAESFTKSDLFNQVSRYVEKNKPKLIFNPGTYQLRVGVKKYPQILEKCFLLIVNREEAIKILGIGDSEINQKDLLSKLLLLGPKNVVITDGAEGSFATDGKGFFRTGIFPAQLVEKTGAGDAYASGLMAGLFYNLPLTEAMIWGTINASHAIQFVGTQNGLLTKDDLERHRKAVSELVAAEF